MEKIKDKTQDEINKELIESTIEFLHQSIQTIEKEIQDENVFGIDSQTGFITKRAHARILDLEQEKRNTLKNIRQLQFQREVYTADHNTPAYDIDSEIDDFDLINTLDQYEKEQREYEEEKTLAEIQAARERGTSQDLEIER